MSLTMRCPEAKAIELGGVETGSMKAYEQPIVAGIMKYRGFTFTRMACKQIHISKNTVPYLIVRAMYIYSAKHIFELNAY